MTGFHIERQGIFTRTAHDCRLILTFHSQLLRQVQMIICGVREEAMSATVKRVVLVVADGLRWEAIERFSLFNLRRLVERGASALTARSVSPDFEAARLASLLTGVSPARHGVLAERPGLPRPIGRVEPMAGVIANVGFQVSAFLPEVPPSLAGRAGLTARDFGFQHPSFRGSRSSEIVTSAINALCTQRRGLIAIRLPDAAHASHLESTSQEYGNAVQRIDQSLGVLASLSGASSGDSLLVVVTDNSSCVSSPVSDDTLRPISVVLFGRCVASSRLDDISLLDIPATLLWALGIAIPMSYEGRPLTEAFDSRPMQVRASA